MRTSRKLRTRAVFVTFRAWSRGHLFGRIANGKMRRNPVGQEVASNWNRIPAWFSNVVLDTFVVMPDHMHAILLLNDHGPQDAVPLPAILDFFRSCSAQSVDCGIWRGNGRKHVIRDRDELDRIRRYIRQNPQRWPRDPAELTPFGRD
jgi:putative transposase